jgi:hypothetical protein
MTGKSVPDEKVASEVAQTIGRCLEVAAKYDLNRAAEAAGFLPRSSATAEK